MQTSHVGITVSLLSVFVDEYQLWQLHTSAKAGAGESGFSQYAFFWENSSRKQTSDAAVV